MTTMGSGILKEWGYEDDVRDFQGKLRNLVAVTPSAEMLADSSVPETMKKSFEDIEEALKKLEGEQKEKLLKIKAAWEQLRKIEKLHQDFLDLYFPKREFTPEVKAKFDAFSQEMIAYQRTTLGEISSMQTDREMGLFKGKLTSSTPMITGYFERSLNNVNREMKKSSSADNNDLTSLSEALQVQHQIVKEVERVKARPLVIQEFNGNQTAFQLNMQLVTKDIKQYLENAYKNAKGVDKANIEIVLDFISTLEKIREKHEAFLKAYQKDTPTGEFNNDTLEAFEALNVEMQNYFDPYGKFMSDYVNLTGKHALEIQKIIQQALPGKDFDLGKLAYQPMVLAANHLITAKDILSRTPESHKEHVNVKALVGKWENLNRQANDYLAAKDAREAFYKEDISNDRKFKAKDTKITISKTVDPSIDGPTIIKALTTALNPAIHKNWNVDPVPMTKKKSGYVIKNERGEPQIKINIYKDHVVVKQIKGTMISRRNHLMQLDILHTISNALRIGDPLPKSTLSSSDPESINYLEAKCRVDKKAEYEISDQIKKQFNQSWREAKAKVEGKNTCDKDFPEFVGKLLIVDASSAVETQKKVQSIISQGMIPEVENGTMLEQCVEKMAELKRYVLDEKDIMSQRQAFEKSTPEGTARREERLEEFAAQIKSIREKINSISKDLDALKKSINQANFPKSITIDISTPDPILAMKQYNAVLGMGFTPVLANKTKEVVRVYVRNNPEDVQINVSAPKVGGDISGKMVLQRFKEATKDGFFARISPESKEAFYQYLQTRDYLKSIESGDTRCELSGDPNPALLVKHLAGMGVLVELPKDSEKANKIIKNIQDKIKEPIEIDCSGGIAGLLSAECDFTVMKDYLEKGISVKVKNQQDLLAYISHQSLLPMIDVSKFPIVKQVELIQTLAKMGIRGSDMIAPNKGIEVPVVSSNPKHAIQLLGHLIRNGFKPTFDDNMQKLAIEYMQNPQHKSQDMIVSLTGNDPKDLFDKTKLCFDMGLKASLSPLQINTLKDYIKKNPSILENGEFQINGYNPYAVRDNIDLAQKLGVKVKCTEPALSANKNGKKAGVMPIIVEDVNNPGKKGTFKLDVEKTMARAKNLVATGCKVELSRETQNYLAGLKAKENDLVIEASKRRFFGIFTPASAKQAQRDLKEVKQYDSFKQEEKNYSIPAVIGTQPSSPVSTQPHILASRQAAVLHSTLTGGAQLNVFKKSENPMTIESLINDFSGQRTFLRKELEFEPKKIPEHTGLDNIIHILNQSKNLPPKDAAKQIATGFEANMGRMGVRISEENQQKIKALIVSLDPALQDEEKSKDSHKYK